jgi:hypothetical protein
MHFDASNLPPVLAFWSVTAYDRDGYFIANPINRYAMRTKRKLLTKRFAKARAGAVPILPEPIMAYFIKILLSLKRVLSIC